MYFPRAKIYPSNTLHRMVLVALLVLGSLAFSLAATSFPASIKATAPAFPAAAAASPSPEILRATAPKAGAYGAGPALTLLKATPTGQTRPTGESVQISQPRSYPTGVYQAYVAARQNEGGPSYEAQPDQAGALLTLDNPAQHLTTRFGAKGANIEGLGLKLSRVGYAGIDSSNLNLAQEVKPRAEGNRVTYEVASGLSQWFVNGPLGLEQGFTLAQPLPGQPDAGHPLEFELKLSGLQQAHLNATGDGLKVTLTEGRVLNYGQLYVYDATGQTFPAHFGLSALSEAEGSYRLTLAVEGVSRANYPLTVDPLFNQSQILSNATPGAPYGSFGVAVALSGDGNIALVGADDGQGVVYVFTRNGPGSNYTQFEILTDSITGQAGDHFGKSVALSSDGNTALIGAYFKTVGSNTYQGAAYIFSRSGPGFIYSRSQLLEDTPDSSPDFFGTTVALSGDGNTALVGASGKTVGSNTFQGEVYVYTRRQSGSNYAPVQVLKDGATGASDDQFGVAVAISGDGNTALVGAGDKKVGTNGAQGVAYVFTRSGAGANYAQPQMLTDLTTGATNDFFGSAVALSGDGKTALIGANVKTVGTNLYQGAAYIFSRSATGPNYTQSQILSDLATGAASDGFGYSVALSANGNIALVGAASKKIGANSYQGATYQFTRSGTGGAYSQSQVLSDPTTGAASDNFGYALALAPDGNTGLVGAPGKVVGANSVAGAVYSFICDPLQVTSGADDSSCGTLRRAVTAAASGPNHHVTIELTPGTVIALPNGLNVPDGVTITTTAPCGSGPGGTPPIIITPGEVLGGDGLTFSGTSTVSNLWVRGFGTRQLVAPPGSHALLHCVWASKA